MCSMSRVLRRGGYSLSSAKYSPIPSRYSLAMVSSELLAFRREEGRKKIAEGRLEMWLEGLIGRLSSLPVPSPPGDMVVPHYTRDVTVRFRHPAVRRKLLKLINTDVVRILDKSFMANLQEKIYQNYREERENRLFNRRMAESMRSKAIHLQYFQESPIDCLPSIKLPFIPGKLGTSRKKIKRRQVKRGKKNLEASQYGRDMETEVTSYLESIAEDEIDPEDRAMNRFSGETSKENAKYESPLVKKLRKLQGVDELYDLADRIVNIKGNIIQEKETRKTKRK